MPVTGPTGIVTPAASGDGSNAALQLAAMEATLRNRINGWFATTAARNTAYASLTSAQKRGIRCWCDDVSAWFTWDSVLGDWRGEPTHRVLMDGHRTFAANPSPPNTAITIIGPSPVILPTGNWWCHIQVSTRVTNLTATPTFAVAALSGTGVSGEEGFLILDVSGSGQATDSRSLDVVVSGGSASWRLDGYNGANANAISFTYSILQVFNMGPA